MNHKFNGVLLLFFVRIKLFFPFLLLSQELDCLEVFYTKKPIVLMRSSFQNDASRNDSMFGFSMLIRENKVPNRYSTKLRPNFTVIIGAPNLQRIDSGVGHLFDCPSINELVNHCDPINYCNFYLFVRQEVLRFEKKIFNFVFFLI